MPQRRCSRRKVEAVDLDALLHREMRHVWPDAFGRRKTARQLEIGRHVQANFQGSDRYTLSLPGSLACRISPLDRSVENMTIAGDWTACGLDAGCIEAAVMSGMLAACAISGEPAPQHHHRLRSSMSGSPPKAALAPTGAPSVTGPIRKAGGFYRTAEDRQAKRRRRPADRQPRTPSWPRSAWPTAWPRRRSSAARASRSGCAKPAIGQSASAATARRSTRPSSWSSGR